MSRLHLLVAVVGAVFAAITTDVARAAPLDDVSTTTLLTTTGITGTTLTSTLLPNATWTSTSQLSTGTTGTTLTSTLLPTATWTAGESTDPTSVVTGESTDPTSVVTGNCSIGEKELACELLQKYSQNLELATTHASGTVDQASASNNLRDMCDGKQAARSNFSCSECPSGAPGGTVCIGERVLNYLIALVSTGPVKVTELAGDCHSCDSKHYQGLAIDFGLGSRNNEYLDMCKQMGGNGVIEPTHTHCQFDN